ncbi:hypothetical protein [Plantactinospora sp. KBS50]|uniref:hypothetical protein n=1 Tax=Plantactinospora sp. KBS50 TaxID=2024580 RepID=UPI000BAAC8D6|nr:hypothetical protein [Plantactinospora sp. KBS50]ASW56062.1 hypothetical protein CIK06_20600 [Plantactinospora sp. KBS50]
MVLSTSRPARLAAVLLITPLALAGCSLGGGADEGGSGAGQQATEDAGQRARERVQAYLDAMKAKDVAAGREQLCAPLQETFDKAATGSSGDFAKHFTVTEAEIVDVSSDNGWERVESTVTVEVSGKSLSRSVSFAVTSVDGAWCIGKEEPAATADPDGSADPDVSAEPSS